MISRAEPVNEMISTISKGAEPSGPAKDNEVDNNATMISEPPGSNLITEPPGPDDADNNASLISEPPGSEVCTKVFRPRY